MQSESSGIQWDILDANQLEMIHKQAISAARRRLGSESILGVSAEDLASEAMVAMLSCSSPIDNKIAFIRLIVNRRYIDLVRRAKTHRSHIEELEIVARARQVRRQGGGQRLLEILSPLNENERSVVELKAWYQLTSNEVAARLRVSLRTVVFRMTSAREKIVDDRS